ncbi:uncharacterized protein BX664DRAFT_335712 [Halteromyces radiatus]|uniref:uncharacterized protein n=1 Tax=Halteromyces radiatus TaxID=101107 RepID=UPI0022203C97|nr:uncharacterized protein BX664DRAFT_335712 [Halteromyces radiatus]KAI8086403.1 hypothetical protein BX664DRAFT_335712 [Halteromyces radiatus]
MANRWTKTFLSLVVFQVLISLPLLVVICTDVNSYQPLEYELHAKINHVRVEVLWFIFFEIWRLWLVIDALIHCSSLTVITCGVLTLFSAGFGALECIETKKMINTKKYVDDPLKRNLVLEFILTGSITALLIPTIYVVYRLALDYGWQTYRKVGAHLNVQSMYFLVNCFSLILKIDTFFEVLIMVFYMLLGVTDGTALTWIPGIMALVTLFGLFFARKSVSDESHWKMIVFIVIQVAFIGMSAWMLFQRTDPDDPWYIVLFYGSTSILMTIVTLVFAIKCQMNFGKGLKPYVHWSLFGKKRPVTTPITNQSILLDDADLEYTGYTVDSDLQQAILKQNRISRDQL